MRMIEQDEDPHTVAIRCVIPFTPRVEDSISNEENAYNINIDGITAQLRFKRIPNQAGGAKIAGTVEADRLGKISYAEVQVWFGEEFISTTPNNFEASTVVDKMEHAWGSNIASMDPEAEYYITSAVKYINRFLEVYKSASHAYWIRPLSVEEIMEFGIRIFEDDENYREISRTITPSEFQGFGGTISNDLDEKLRVKLINESPVNPYQKLDLDALDKLSTQEYDLAVIASYRFLEFWVKSAVETILDANGWSQSKIDDKIKTDGEYDKFNNICYNHIPDHIGFDYVGTSEFQQFKQEAYELRHEIIHEGKSATPQEASDAYAACSHARQPLLDEFENQLRDTNLYSIPVSDLDESD
ncbi:hypothetical protein [Natronosalvus rutilus]|uniref:Uncharacterized protein n=1 Tax=Natronosalvus rutilus TaxID=2953753 RepID=A0A9E7NCI7_9EURY|nr:hypothetical protein [Natronosalvus rutilus]UTF54473.1 hypothetical protein NGM29_04120 [Natronosalvus rutilus]